VTLLPSAYAGPETSAALDQQPASTVAAAAAAAAAAALNNETPQGDSRCQNVYTSTATGHMHATLPVSSQCQCCMHVTSTCSTQQLQVEFAALMCSTTCTAGLRSCPLQVLRQYKVCTACLCHANVSFLLCPRQQRSHTVHCYQLHCIAAQHSVNHLQAASSQSNQEVLPLCIWLLALR
jgi:hypothetical protein